MSDIGMAGNYSGTAAALLFRRPSTPGIPVFGVASPGTVVPGDAARLTLANLGLSVSETLHLVGAIQKRYKMF
jgi:hypothetical protein